MALPLPQLAGAHRVGSLVASQGHPGWMAGAGFPVRGPLPNTLRKSPVREEMQARITGSSGWKETLFRIRAQHLNCKVVLLLLFKFFFGCLFFFFFKMRGGLGMSAGESVHLLKKIAGSEQQRPGMVRRIRRHTKQKNRKEQCFLCSYQQVP